MSSWQQKARYLAEQGQLREAAELLVQNGALKAAADVYLRAGDGLAAANCLVRLQDYGPAGELFLKSIPSGKLRDAGALTPEERRTVLKAATCFGRAAAVDRAVRLYMAVDEPQRAADLLRRAGRGDEAAQLLRAGAGAREMGAQQAAVEAARRFEAAGNLQAAISAYERLGHHAEAGRVAASAGAWSEAAQLFLRAGDGVRAGECFLAQGEKLQALKAWTRVPRSDARYAAVVRRAVQVATEISHLDFELDHFVAPFVKGAAQRGDVQDVTVLMALATLYEQHGFEESAEESLRAVLALDPQHPAAQQRLATVAQTERASPMVYQKILEEDLSFQGRDRPGRRKGRGLGDVPVGDDGLPELPDLPPAPGGAAAPEVPAAARAETVERFRGGTQRGVAEAPAAPTAPTPPQPTPEGGPLFVPGALIADRYELVSQIGSGGMATVFRARDLVLDEDCALKVFKQVVDDPDAVARFKRELKLSRQLQHPNVLRVYDYGLQGGANFMTMELLEGEELADRIDRRLEPIPISLILLWLRHAAAGLAEAHGQGVVHRDVKPQNMFLINGGMHLKIMDFGVARVSHAPKISRTGMIVGTPEYMAPEQISGTAELGPGADIYALGVVAYELLTRDVPFQCEELMPLLMKHLNDVPVPPRELAPQTPAELDALVVSMLSKSPGDRPPDCHELGRILADFAARLGGLPLEF